MTVHPFRAATLKGKLKLCWTSQNYYPLPGGPIKVRANRVGLAEPILGLPVKGKGKGWSKKLNPPQVLYLYQNPRGAWYICRDGRLCAHAMTRAAFEDHLLSEMRLILLERALRAVVLPGRLVRAGERTILEILVESGTSSADSGGQQPYRAAETRPLLVLGIDASSPEGRVSARILRAMPLRFVGALSQRPDRVILREDDVQESEPVEETITDSEALPWILSSAVSWGTDPESGFRLLLDYISGCTEFAWSGQPGRAVNGARDLLAQPLPNGPPPSDEAECPGSPRAAEGLLVRHVAGHCVTFAPGLMRPLFLDPQAEAILRLCDGQTRVEEIADVAAEVFDADRAQVETRLRRLLGTLLRAGILDRQEPSKSVDLVHVPARAVHQVGL